MKRKVNYWAVVIYYIIAIVCRYLTNKTELLSTLENPYLKSILKGAGPALGAVFVFFVFNIKPALSLRGNCKSFPNYPLLGIPCRSNKYSIVFYTR